MKYPLERLKESLKERLSLYKHELLLFERKRILKKDDIRQGAAKTFKKIMSVGYKKFRMRAIDGYARISQTNIFKCYIEWDQVLKTNGQLYKKSHTKAKNSKGDTLCFSCLHLFLFKKFTN